MPSGRSRCGARGAPLVTVGASTGPSRHVGAGPSRDGECSVWVPAPLGMVNALCGC